MLLYHGSIYLISSPTLYTANMQDTWHRLENLGKHKRLDYGNGFYTTPEIVTAEEWACEMLYSQLDSSLGLDKALTKILSEGKLPTVNTYEFNNSKGDLVCMNLMHNPIGTLTLLLYSNLDFLVEKQRINLDVAQEEMNKSGKSLDTYLCECKEYSLKFIKNNIKVLEEYYKCDYIIGPRFDSNYLKLPTQFSQGLITHEIFCDLLDKTNIGKQVYLRTEKAFSRLEHLPDKTYRLNKISEILPNISRYNTKIEANNELHRKSLKL